MKIRLSLLYFSLFISISIIAASGLYAMPQASDDDSEEAGEDNEKTSQATPQDTPPPAEDEGPAIPTTQFETIELEKNSGIPLIKVSEQKSIEGLTQLFEESKKLHDTMTEILSNLEEMRNNLVQSFHDTANKLDTTLREVSIKAGTISQNTLPLLQQVAPEQKRKND